VQEGNIPQRLCVTQMRFVTRCGAFECVNGAKRAPKLLLKKLEFRQIALGDKIIFFPHSVDNIMPDK
jgi:hypothetical protein